MEQLYTVGSPNKVGNNKKTKDATIVTVVHKPISPFNLTSADDFKDSP